MAYAALTDVRMYYELDGSGPPLLLIPGLGSTGRSWEPTMPHLIGSFTVIRPDNRGVGRSEPIRPARALRDYTADLVELLDHLQTPTAFVLGQSLGGIIAQRLAADHPSRVEKLVLVSCTHRFEPYLREMIELLGATLRGGRLPGGGDLFTRTLELLGSGPAYFDADPNRVEKALRRAEEAGVPRADVLHQLRCLMESKPIADAGVETAIRRPTLIVGGQYDAIIPPYYARRMADDIPDSRFLLVPNAGHKPLADCPERVVPAIIRFLKTGEPGELEGGESCAA